MLIIFDIIYIILDYIFEEKGIYVFDIIINCIFINVVFKGFIEFGFVVGIYL